MAGKITKVAAEGAKLAIRYGPQAKIVWDRGGRQAASAAAKRVKSLNARRKALAHASGLVEGAILKIAPTGAPVYVVFSEDVPVATYPPQQLPYAVLLEHADLNKRVAAPLRTPRPRRRRKGATTIATLDD